MSNQFVSVFSFIPRVGVGNSCRLAFLRAAPSVKHEACFVANVNSLVFDYLVRQKLGGAHFLFSILEQLPVLQPSAYSDVDLDVISKHVLELVFTAFDLQEFARTLGYGASPFGWDENRRAVLRAELDAYFAHLYGLTRQELRYILDPKDIFGDKFPGETFRILRDREIKELGEYRTQRLVLSAFDELGKSARFAEEAEKRETVIEVPVKRSMVTVS